MFKPGDRIWSWIDGKREEGTVDRVEATSQIWTFWDSDKARGDNGSYWMSEEECFHIELKYDPMQQGDTDEDI